MKRIITLLLLLMFCINGWSQNREKMQERIKAQKVAFITERLDLSSNEAQSFWPIYNDFADRTHAMRQKDLKEIREAMRRGDLSEDESQRLLEKFMQVEDNMHEAKKQLVKDLADVLPPQKIIKLKVAEEAFNRRLMEILKDRKAEMSNKRKNRNNP
jgi:hypothetical protein